MLTVCFYVLGLQGNSSVEVEEEDYLGPLPSTPTDDPDYLLWLSWIFIISFSCYMFSNSRTGLAIFEYIGHLGNIEHQHVDWISGELLLFWLCVLHLLLFAFHRVTWLQLCVVWKLSAYNHVMCATWTVFFNGHPYFIFPLTNYFHIRIWSIEYLDDRFCTDWMDKEQNVIVFVCCMHVFIWSQSKSLFHFSVCVLL